MTKHLLIPDTQVKEGTPLHHLEALGNYIVKKRPDVIVHIGDHWDMPSLSSYDRGKKAMEGRRVLSDIEAGKRGMEALLTPMWNLQAKQRANRKKVYTGKSLLDRDEFYSWALTHVVFQSLFENWEQSGYNRKLTPSVDRVNSGLGYTLENMEWVTHGENSRRGSNNRWNNDN